MIRIKSLSLAGFRGIRQPLKIDFTGGFTVLTGANGSGKSSILDAIEFGLSGKVSKYEDGSGERGEKSSAYTWWRGSKPATERYVRLEFVDERGAVTTVTRRPESLTVEDDSALLNLLCDRDLNAESSIEELCRTSIIRDELIAKNSVDLPETERFAFVSAAVGVATDSTSDAKLTQAAKLGKRRTEEAQREYDRIRRQVQDQVELLSTARAQLPEREAVEEAQQRLRNLLNLPLGSLEELLTAADREIRSLRYMVANLAALSSLGTGVTLRRAQLEASGALASSTELKSQLDKLAASHAESDETLAASTVELRAVQESQTFISNLAQLHQAGTAIGRRSESCPLCGSHIEEIDFRAHLEAVRKEVETHGAQVAVAVARERAARSLEQQLRVQLDATRTTYERIRSEISTVQGQLDAFNAEIARISPAHSGLSLDDLQKEHQNSRERLAMIEQARRMLTISDHADRILDLERDLESIKIASISAEKQVAKARRVEEQIKEASATLKRISAEAVEERLAAIRPLFTELYLRLRPHIDWKTVNYAVRGDVRRFLSLRVDEDLNLKFLFSSGQRRATGLAFLISVALSRPWCRFRTLVLDDPIQHVDDFRAVHLVETLAAIRTMKYQLVCAVEDPALAELMTRRLRSSNQETGTLVRMRYVPGDGAQIEETRAIAPFEVVMVAQAS